MAVARACLGKATATGALVTNLTTWSLTREAEEVDTSVMGSCSKTSTPGSVKTTLNLTGFWEAVSGQNDLETALATGSTLNITVFPTGSGTAGDRKLSATYNVIAANIEGPGVDSLVTFSFTGVANALPTETAATA